MKHHPESRFSLSSIFQSKTQRKKNTDRTTAVSKCGLIYMIYDLDMVSSKTVQKFPLKLLSIFEIVQPQKISKAWDFIFIFEQRLNF